MFIQNPNTNRARVRYKRYEDCYLNYVNLSVDSMDSLANYSQLSLVSSLNIEEHRRLMLLASDECEPYTYYPDVGYKARCKYPKHPDDQWVYVLAMATKTSTNPDRAVEKVRTYRLSNIPEELREPNRLMEWHKMAVQAPALRFLDRLSKKSQQKLLMLKMLEPGVYLEGHGFVLTSLWDPKGVRRYYIEE